MSLLFLSREDNSSASHSSDSCSSDSDSDTDSITAPPLSPAMITTFHDTEGGVIQELPSNLVDLSTILDASTNAIPSLVYTDQPAMSNTTEQLEATDPDLVENPIPRDTGNDRPADLLVPCTEEVTCRPEGGSTTWNGFKLVGDNIDKNYRQSLHRVDRKTTSIHYFHHYAVQDRIDLSACSEALPTRPIDGEVHNQYG